MGGGVRTEEGRCVVMQGWGLKKNKKKIVTLLYQKRNTGKARPQQCQSINLAPDHLKTKQNKKNLLATNSGKLLLNYKHLRWKWHSQSLLSPGKFHLKILMYLRLIYLKHFWWSLLRSPEMMIRDYHQRRTQCNFLQLPGLFLCSALPSHTHRYIRMIPACPVLPKTISQEPLSPAQVKVAGHPNTQTT